MADGLKLTVAPLGEVASTVRSGSGASVGGVVSTTVTTNVPLARFAAASWVEQRTVVRPSGKAVPDAGTHFVSTEPSTSSRAEGRNVTTVPLREVASRRMSAGSSSFGAILSSVGLPTMTAKDPVATFPWASFAVQVTVVVPIGKSEPDPGSQVGCTVPSTSSTAVAAKTKRRPDLSAEAPPRSPGRLSFGALSSRTMTMNCPRAR